MEAIHTMTRNSDDNEDRDGDAVLIAFADAGPGADLADWTRRYPEHAGSLARLAARRWAGAPGALSPDNAAADARVVAIGRAALQSACAARAERTRRSAAVSPIASLLLLARERGLEPQAVAERLGLTEVYFWKLHRRLFAPASVPRALTQALGEVLGRAAEDIAAYLARPPALAAGASYRADRAPRTGDRENFAAALRADAALSDAQRARWHNPDASSGE